MTNVRRPALRYHGGKFLLARWIISHMPEHQTYLEPFGGAISTLLRKPPSYAEVVGDLDTRLQRYFAVLRNPESYAALKRALIYTPFHEKEFKEIRDGKRPADNDIEEARQLCVLSFMSHGSDSLSPSAVPGFRSSVTRTGTTPSHDWSNLPDQMDEIHARLRRVTWMDRDAFELIEKYDTPKTLIYADPPYPRSTRSQKVKNGKFYHGYAHEFDTDEEHEKLLTVLNNCQSMVMISGYQCELYDDMLSGWVRHDKTSQMDGKAKKTESLWINPAAQSKQTNPDLFGV